MKLRFIHMFNNLTLIQVYDFSSIKAICFFLFLLLPLPPYFLNLYFFDVRLILNVLTDNKSGAYSPFHTNFRGGRGKQRKIVVKVLFGFYEKIHLSQMTRKVEKEK